MIFSFMCLIVYSSTKTLYERMYLSIYIEPLEEEQQSLIR